jgi:hypothetical protein
MKEEKPHSPYPMTPPPPLPPSLFQTQGIVDSSVQSETPTRYRKEIFIFDLPDDVHSLNNLQGYPHASLRALQGEIGLRQLGACALGNTNNEHCKFPAI